MSHAAQLPEGAALAILKERGLTLGCAESCTGGLIAKRLTDVPGASAVFRGGVVSYTNGVKTAVLGVPADLLEERGAVCAPVAAAMARGALRVLGCDAAVSATGVAGPDSDGRGNPVGLVYVALAAPDGCWVRELRLSGGRDQVRAQAADRALELLLGWARGLPLDAEEQ